MCARRTAVVLSRRRARPERVGEEPPGSRRERETDPSCGDALLHEQRATDVVDGGTLPGREVAQGPCDAQHTVVSPEGERSAMQRRIDRTAHDGLQSERT